MKIVLIFKVEWTCIWSETGGPNNRPAFGSPARSCSSFRQLLPPGRPSLRIRIQSAGPRSRRPRQRHRSPPSPIRIFVHILKSCHDYETQYLYRGIPLCLCVYVCRSIFYPIMSSHYDEPWHTYVLKTHLYLLLNNSQLQGYIFCLKNIENRDTSTAVTINLIFVQT